MIIPSAQRLLGHKDVGATMTYALCEQGSNGMRSPVDGL